MKAVVLYQPGGPEKLTYTDYPTPSVSSGEILIKVKACSINHLDLWIRNGLSAYKTVFPHILGSDISGVVDTAGSDVKEFSRGTPVIVSPNFGCFKCPYCLSGKDNQCNDFKIVGASLPGGYAEFIKVPVQHLLRAPENLSFEESAAFPLTFLTAWHMVVTKGNLQAGQTILILGGGSGIGSAAIQISKLLGANIVATAGSPEKLEKAKELGANWVINHETENILERVRQITRSEGVDLVFEHVGPKTWKQSIASLKKGGRLVTCGSTTGPATELDLRFIFSRHLSILGSSLGTRAELMTIVKLMEQKKLHPVIDRTYPLNEASKAHERIESRHFFGKIVLIP
ncbi:MAG: zinc-binding dehydrogenase [Nitrospirae bacterium]|nr:zinc-binding dehydrogenase [Nitrospirota bacterium]